MKTLRLLLVINLLFLSHAYPAPPDVKRTTTGKIKSGLEMVFVEGGTFTMGGHDHADDGGPEGGADTDECPHTREVRDFFIGRYEVTQADWMTIMGNNPSHFQKDAECPVEQISWNDAQEFIRRLNIKFDEKYRLPTETEWEFAARGGLKSAGYRYAGGNDLNEIAWYRENSGKRPHSVGELKPNELGIYDMSGNIWEWCNDFKTPYPCDFVGKKFDSKTLRGGSWAHDAQSLRSRDRNGRTPDHRLLTLGFRLAK